MTSGIRIGRLFGIDIAIHPSWFIILVVITWSLATGVFPNAYRWSSATYWVVAVIAALLLFASVLLHELAHSLVAEREGIPVKSIVLFLMGGVSNIEREPASPGREAVMAGAGPLTSLVLGGALYALGRLVQSPETVRATLLYLGGINLLLGVFNLLPGFPLDGGRVLRAVLWARSGDLERATRGAARTGVILGWLMVLYGVITAVTTSLVAGVWTGFVGWVLVQASQASYAHTVTEGRLGRVRVATVMTPPPDPVPAEMTLRVATHDHFLSRNTRCLPVGDEGEPFAGVICLADLRKSERSNWDVERVQDVMTPRSELATVTPHASLADALQLMARHNVNQVAVVEDGKLVGFVDRAAALQYLEIATTVRGDGSPSS